jgi:hypothetical protein
MVEALSNNFLCRFDLANPSANLEGLIENALGL